jgi:hypothetical protein
MPPAASAPVLPDYALIPRTAFGPASNQQGYYDRGRPIAETAGKLHG